MSVTRMSATLWIASGRPLWDSADYVDYEAVSEGCLGVRLLPVCPPARPAHHRAGTELCFG